MTIPAIAPPESLCDEELAADDEEDVDEVAIGIEDAVPVVDWTTATPRANPSYGDANACADESVAVKIEVAFKAELS